MKHSHADVVKFLLSQGAKVSTYLRTYIQQQYNVLDNWDSREMGMETEKNEQELAKVVVIHLILYQ